MTNLVKKLSLERKSALTAGIVLIIMIIAAAFSYGIVHGSLVVKGDASVTYNNIVTSHMLFNAGILGWLIILICDIVVAWSFYIFLKPLNKNLSLLGAWFRLTYASILGIAILNLIFVLICTNSSDFLSFLKTDQLQALVMLFLEAFDIVWSIGLIIFGGHLMIVGYLTFKTDTIPKVISILLMIASISYIIINSCYTFLPQFNGIISILESILTVPMILGELGFGIWLLFKGGKVTKSYED
ncbi:DUF4386 domain-containing protein [Metabacillus bambusae]|uniref:DUF4386 domain-containing protein n=1 Tax=Metabacillus bambusae TaxID=2795218 RepID=A0ABS3N5Z8_9BACI|nr:DUF4386 domain-containing protein [Metabacillus bambusae]MBO1513648.1 DUF4386 domain-containing protein [Metabacillus bambusae]